jgi:hypothetical protein
MCVDIEIRQYAAQGHILDRSGSYGVKLEYSWGRHFKRRPICARCFNVDHYFAKLITTAAIGLAQLGMEDTRLRVLPSRKCSS